MIVRWHHLEESNTSDCLKPVSYTHLDVYKRQVLSELSQKNVDLGMAGLSPDPARADAMEFSDLYYKACCASVSTETWSKSAFISLEYATIPPLKYSEPVSYTHLDVYKRQVLYTFSQTDVLYRNLKLIGDSDYNLSLIHI